MDEFGSGHARKLDAERRRVSGRGAEVERIAQQRLGRSDRRLDARGHVVELVKRYGCRLHLVDQRAHVVVPGVDHELAEQRRVIRHLDGDFHEEAVAHGCRDLERLFALDAVAIGEDLQVGKLVLGVEGVHVALRHRPKHERVNLRPGPVDLVEEEDGKVGAMLEQRTGFDAWLAVPGDVGVVEEIARHQVDGAFDALECTADSAGEGLEEGRLAHAHVPFEQDMAACKGREQQQAYGPLLPDHDLIGTGIELQCPIAP